MKPCTSCKYFRPVDQKEYPGECRKAPPTLFAWGTTTQHLESGLGSQQFYEVSGCWPTTDGLGCGEHQPKESNHAEG